MPLLNPLASLDRIFTRSWIKTGMKKGGDMNSTINLQTNQTRYHAFDTLRAIMMLLGVYIHAVAAFSTIPHVWWYKDALAGAAYDVQLLAIHTFRMPVFFVMAGFFAALLIKKRGSKSFIRNRKDRILIPFLLSSILIIPLLKALQLCIWIIEKKGTFQPDLFFKYYLSMFKHLGTAHFWFLLYLVYFYLLAIAFRSVHQFLKNRFTGFSKSIRLSAWMQGAQRPIRYLFISLSLIGLLNIKVGVFPAPQGILPDWRSILAYGPFVLFGWLLYNFRDGLDQYAKKGWKMLGIGLAWMGLAILFCQFQMTDPVLKGVWHLLTALAGAACVWYMIYGLIGIFLKYFNSPSQGGRFLSDSSYWIYIVHAPVLLLFQMQVFKMSWSAEAKMIYAFLMASIVSVVSYNWLVRPTFIGKLLNGKKQPPLKLRFRKAGKEAYQVQG